ncbi:hypothetical protein Taro_043734 [Colocasia esculenta]|uniref:Uncharacterized protein n=1 Tax=Colocasia esculenta TaxID=4460 RepID=A0A843WST9_COLES|nr:hypothetical protein [Colocasia esculenta]
MSKPQLFFPSYNRTPKHHRCLNTLHQTLADKFTSCWGRVEAFLAAGEQEIVNTKPFFFPFSSTATCTNRPLEVNQGSINHVNFISKLLPFISLLKNQLLQSRFLGLKQDFISAPEASEDDPEYTEPQTNGPLNG